MGVSCPLTFSCIFNLLALVLVAVSFSTDYWLVYNVDTKEISGKKTTTEIEAREKAAPYLYESRRRGLFRICFDDNPVYLTEHFPEKGRVHDGNCLAELGYDIGDFKFTEDEKRGYNVDKIEKRTRYQRAQWMLAALGVLIILLAASLCPIACWRQTHCTIVATAIASLIGAACYETSVGLFVFIYDTIENDIDMIDTDHPDPNKKIHEWFPMMWAHQSSKEYGFLGNSDGYNKNVTDISYHFSFWLGAVGGGLAFISCLISFFTALCMKPSRSKDYEDTKKEPQINGAAPTLPQKPQPIAAQPNQAVQQPTTFIPQPVYAAATLPPQTFQAQPAQAVQLHPGGFLTNVYN